MHSATGRTWATSRSRSPWISARPSEPRPHLTDRRGRTAPSPEWAPARILLLFLDGVGIGVDDPDVNPLVHAAARLPALVRLLGGAVPTLGLPRVEGASGRSFPLDATLGVEGTPQSGTGQAALLTGESTAERYGRHFGPWTPVRLRPLVEERSVLRRAAQGGRTVAFANAYPKWWPGPKGGRRIAAPPLAARGAGVLDRHEEALAEGTAVASEIVNDGWRTRLGHASLPDVSPAEAGANLARVSGQADLTLYAHYATDTAGHRRERAAAVDCLVRLDAFVGGLMEHVAPDTLLFLASDHGNLEDVRTGHTRNPALGAASGPGSERSSDISDIREVTPLLLELLGVP